MLQFLTAGCRQNPETQLNIIFPLQQLSFTIYVIYIFTIYIIYVNTYAFEVNTNKEIRDRTDGHQSFFYKPIFHLYPASEFLINGLSAHSFIYND